MKPIVLRHRSESARLVEELVSDNPATFESARTRLTTLGGRAVPALVDALDGECPLLRARAISVLSTIRDARAREPIIAQLLDSEVRVRVAAALALARFPCERSVDALERAIRDATYPVRLAAVQSLIVVFRSGFDHAVRTVLSLLFDIGADRRLRHAACEIIPALPSGERRHVLRTLRSDPDPDIEALARRMEAPPNGDLHPELSGLTAALDDLGSPHAERWGQAVHRLAGFGEAVIAPLVDAMVRRASPGYCARAGMALRALGARRAHPIGEWLQKVDDPLALGVLVEAVGGLEDKQLIYRMKDVIDRLRVRAAAGPLPEEFQRVRARCHLQLSRIGSRVAIDDLKDGLGTPDQRVPVEMLAAVEAIGTRDELPDLLRAWRKEEEFLRSRIAEVFLLIMRREKVRRTNRVFAALSPADREALDAILPEAGSRPGASSSRPPGSAAPLPIAATRAPSRRARGARPPR